MTSLSNALILNYPVNVKLHTILLRIRLTMFSVIPKRDWPRTPLSRRIILQITE